MDAFKPTTAASFSRDFRAKPFSGWSGVVAWKPTPAVQQNFTALGHIGNVPAQDAAKAGFAGAFQNKLRRGTWSGNL